jgi:hypothetical protein
MRVTLRHFALIRETIGRQTEERTIEPGTSISGIYDLLATDHPRLAPLKASVMMMAHSCAKVTRSSSSRRSAVEATKAGSSA